MVIHFLVTIPQAVVGYCRQGDDYNGLGILTVTIPQAVVGYCRPELVAGYPSYSGVSYDTASGSRVLSTTAEFTCLFEEFHHVTIPQAVVGYCRPCNNPLPDNICIVTIPQAVVGYCRLPASH